MEAGIPARLSAAEGRTFGFTVGAAFLVLAAVGYFWRENATAGRVLGTIGGLLIVAGALIPTHLGPVQRGWMRLAHLISKVTTPIVLGIVFFLVMTPIGLIMRLAGRRSLVHKAKDGSFWAAPASGGRSNLERQF